MFNAKPFFSRNYTVDFGLEMVHVVLSQLSIQISLLNKSEAKSYLESLF